MSMNGKTIGNWLDTLPDDVKVKAFANVHQLSKDPQHVLGMMTSKLQYALTGAFPWEESKEGPEYWTKIHMESNE